MGSVDRSLEVGTGGVGGIVESSGMNFKEACLSMSEEVASEIKTTLEASFFKLFETKNAEVLEENKRLGEEVQQLKAKLQGLKVNLEGLEKKVQQLEEELRESKCKLEAKEKEVEELRVKVQTLRSTLDSLKKAINGMEDQEHIGSTSDPETEQEHMDTDSDNGHEGEEEESRPVAPLPPPATEPAISTNPVENQNNEAEAVFIVEMKDIKDEPADWDSDTGEHPSTVNPWSQQPFQPEPFLWEPYQQSMLHGGATRMKGQRGVNSFTRRGGQVNGSGDFNRLDLNSLLFPNGRDRTMYGLRPSTIFGGQARPRRCRRRGCTKDLFDEEVRIHHMEGLVNEALDQYFCSCGGDSFANKLTLQKHINYYNTPWVFSCKYCESGENKRFPYLHNLRQHLKKVHNKIEMEYEGKTGCTKCGQLFESKGEKKLHQLTGCTIVPASR